MGRDRLLTLAVALSLAAVGCGGRETGEQRVTRVRDGYRIEPNGFRMRQAADGARELAVDLLVVDTGRETLATLTLLVHVEGPDGRDPLTRRAPMAVPSLLLGITAPFTAVVRDVELRPGENVLLELEGAPPQEARRDYPEYAGAGRSGS